MPDDERVIALREQLATAASERDHARRERDQALRLVDNLRKQLHEERAASASATSAAVSVASDTSEGGDSAMTAEGVVSGTTTAAMRAMFEGMHVIASELHLHDVIERVIDITTRVLNCERVTLFLADERAEELFVLLSKDGLQARNSAQFCAIRRNSAQCFTARSDAPRPPRPAVAAHPVRRGAGGRGGARQGHD